MFDLPQNPASGALAVVAVGGAAILRPDQIGKHRDQVLGARRVARSIVFLLKEGYRVVVVPGAGPQLGRELLRNEEASTKLPGRPLHVSLASTQGTLGYLLAVELRNVLKQSGLRRQVSTVLTQVLVSREDPAFEVPRHPVGPYYTAWRAKELARSVGWTLVEDTERGWRRVVPRLRPLDVFGLDGIEALLARGHVVVAAGGGGIPLAMDNRGNFVGVEASVDKDETASLLAGHLEAEMLLLLSPADHVYTDFGMPEQRVVERKTAVEMRALIATGNLPADGIGQKVVAACNFVEEGGDVAVITSIGKVAAAIADRAGTRIVTRPGETAVRRQLNLFGEGRDDDEASPEGDD